MIDNDTIKGHLNPTKKKHLKKSINYHKTFLNEFTSFRKKLIKLINYKTAAFFCRYFKVCHFRVPHFIHQHLHKEMKGKEKPFMKSKCQSNKIDIFRCN